MNPCKKAQRVCFSSSKRVEPAGRIQRVCSACFQGVRANPCNPLNPYQNGFRTRVPVIYIRVRVCSGNESYCASMDLQIWLVPLLSLVGGATGAAIINNMFGIRKQRADRVEEHDRWLRNEKLESYSGFVDAARTAFDKVPLIQPQDVAGYAQAVDDSRLPLSRIMLVAGDDILEAARAASHALLEFAKDSVRYDDEDPERARSMDEHGKVFMAKLQRLQELCRQDLGVSEVRNK